MRKFLDFSVLLQRERTHMNTGVVSFDPPGERNNGNDWVLVLDDASKKFAAPGRSMLFS